MKGKLLLSEQCIEIVQKKNPGIKVNTSVSFEMIPYYYIVDGLKLSKRRYRIDIPDETVYRYSIAQDMLDGMSDWSSGLVVRDIF